MAKSGREKSGGREDFERAPELVIVEVISYIFIMYSLCFKYKMF
jgi:hypothetical protein